MNNKNGVETFADKNSPNMVYEPIVSMRRKVTRVRLTIDSTIMDKAGSGVVSGSLAGCSALGIGGRSAAPAPTASSSSGMGRLGRCWFVLNETRGRRRGEIRLDDCPGDGDPVVSTADSLD
jgi:hypothetical protein